MRLLAYFALPVSLTLALLSPAAPSLASEWTETIVESKSAEVAAQKLREASASLSRQVEVDAAAKAQLAQGIEAFFDYYQVSGDGYGDLRVAILDNYIAAAEITAEQGAIAYTDRLYLYGVEQNAWKRVAPVFRRFLDLDVPETKKYLARIDAARTAAYFSDEVEAEKQYVLAIESRDIMDASEAHFQYATYLYERKRFSEAMVVLDRFSAEQRAIFIELALLRQKVAHAIGGNTKEVDLEVDALRKALSNSPFVGDIHSINSTPRNDQLSAVLSLLPVAHASPFSHVNAFDDSRGPQAAQFISSNIGNVTRAVINMAEVLYNEARGEPFFGQLAVAWAIRNRAYINMNGCDFYPGAQGQGNVGACRAATPLGPQASTPGYGDAYQRYSCVIHGGKTSVGATHFQMDDKHVPSSLLGATSLVGTVLATINGWLPDFTSENTPSGTFNPGGIPGPLPLGGIIVFGTTNPAGAQEWRGSNYCAANNSCKVRLGNVGGTLTDPGNSCPGGDPATNGDNFFYGRKR